MLTASSGCPVSPHLARAVQLHEDCSDSGSTTSRSSWATAPRDTGLALFSGDEARSGEITDEIFSWDAGTEVSQPPGLGDDQAPRQSGPNMGDDEGGTVHKVSDDYSYGAPTTLLRVTLTVR